MTSKENTVITIEPIVFPVLAFSFFALPLKWIFGWLVAIAVHECCHYIALCFFGVQVWKVQIGFCGVKMQTDSMSLFPEFICALAGPLGSSLLFLLSKQFPYVAVCAFAHCVFNLLPVRTMDGGRMLRCIVSVFFRDETAETVCRIIGIAIQCLLIISILFLFVKGVISIAFALPVLYLVIHFISREKHLAKTAK